MAAKQRQRDSIWGTESRITLGRALLLRHPEAASAADLAFAMRKDPSNTRKIADELVEAGAIEHIEPDKHSRKKAGRRPDRLFAFAAGERDRFAELFGEPSSPGLIPGHQLVFVDASLLGAEVLESIAQPELLTRAAWSALCDGKRQELVIAFEGAHAVDNSMDLLAALSAAKVDATRAAVSKVDTGAELARWAREAI